jgi:hypothetical protein
MKTQLFFDLTAGEGRPSVHFRQATEIEEIVEHLREENVAIFEIDGVTLSSREELFKAFATALKTPKGW